MLAPYSATAPTSAATSATASPAFPPIDDAPAICTPDGMDVAMTLVVPGATPATVVVGYELPTAATELAPPMAAMEDVPAGAGAGIAGAPGYVMAGATAVGVTPGGHREEVMMAVDWGVLVRHPYS